MKVVGDRCRGELLEVWEKRCSTVRLGRRSFAQQVGRGVEVRFGSGGASAALPSDEGGGEINASAMANGQERSAGWGKRDPGRSLLSSGSCAQGPCAWPFGSAGPGPAVAAGNQSVRPAKGAQRAGAQLRHISRRSVRTPRPQRHVPQEAPIVPSYPWPSRPDRRFRDGPRHTEPRPGSQVGMAPARVLAATHDLEGRRSLPAALESAGHGCWGSPQASGKKMPPPECGGLEVASRPQAPTSGMRRAGGKWLVQRRLKVAADQGGKARPLSPWSGLGEHRYGSYRRLISSVWPKHVVVGAGLRPLAGVANQHR